MELDLPQRVRDRMGDLGVMAIELQAVVEDPERVETSGALVAYHGRVADRRFRVVAIADTEPLAIMYFDIQT